MVATVVVVGAGYAGAGAVQALEDELDGAEIVWVSDSDTHLVLHEVHRAIRDPSVGDLIDIPVSEIKSESTAFVEGEMVGLDTDDRAVELADGRTVDYDYALLCIGSQTAFFGIDGLAEHAHTLKSLDDAVGIHEAVMERAADATQQDPVQVVVGGAGLSGTQAAGEIAALRDESRAPIDVTIVEGLDSVLPNAAPSLQDRARRLLDQADVEVHTGDFIDAVDEETVSLGEETELDYDVLIWTGGITGPDALAAAGVEADERDRRIEASADFSTSDERVFAVGDAAHVDQGSDDEAPPTAQAAWDAADVAAENVARAIRGAPPRTWRYEDQGTLVSVGDRAIAHGVKLPPANVPLPVETFDRAPAEILKKAAAARWIGRITSWQRALRAWRYL